MNAPKLLRMLRKGGLILTLLWILAGASPQVFAISDHVIAVKDVTVIPMDSERVIGNQTVLIDRDRIVAIGSSDRIKIPAGARVVDGSGKYLIPGLFDMHIHLEPGRERSLVLYLANGITTVRNMSGRQWHLQLRERIAKKEVPGPRFFTTSPTTYHSRMENTPEAAEKFVIEQKKAGYDSIKMYGTRPDFGMSSETYVRLLKTARKHGMRVVGHTPRGLPFQTVLDNGQSSVDHAEEIYYVYKPILSKLGAPADFQFGNISLEDYRKMDVKFPDLEQEIRPLIRDLAKKVARSGVVVTPGLVTYETILRQVTDEYDQMLKDPKTKYMYPLWRLYVSPGYNSYRRRWSDRINEMIPILENTLAIQKLMVSEFQKEGVTLMAGTDATNPFVIEGFSLHDEMEKLVESGLRPYDALKAATATPAKFLAIDNHVGTVAVGKKADLVLLEADPLRDIRNTKRIAGVFAEGEFLSKNKIAKTLEKLVHSYEPFWDAIQGARKYFSKGDVKGALDYYKGLSSKTEEISGYFESTVNRRGYGLIRRKKLDEAERVFRLNTDYFPTSANAWDSLAELYSLKGNKGLAIEYYKKSLKLNPNNTNAVAQIRKLETKN